jgi:hypothetical protein
LANSPGVQKQYHYRQYSNSPSSMEELQFRLH